MSQELSFSLSEIAGSKSENAASEEAYGSSQGESELRFDPSWGNLRTRFSNDSG